MNQTRAQRKGQLIGFLKQIQKAGVPVDSIGEEEGLVASGLIDSLAIMEIVVYLEENYGIDFSSRGIDPEELSSIGSILDLIEREVQKGAAHGRG
jgi:methoxymalonate biosynthesis acyl carrier protein